jgi:prepilin-type N-terminal cleavage/methylation domain-containing protein
MKPNGYTLVEVLIALALSAILFAGLGSVIGQVLETREAVHGKNDLTTAPDAATERQREHQLA